MRKTKSRWQPALMLGMGISLLGASGCGQADPVAPAAAASVAAGATTPAMVAHKVAHPAKGQRANAPPTRGKASTALKFDTKAKWKTDPKTHAVFALDGKQVWFLDPSSGWPYTIDTHGVVYTVDPATGIVYDLGKASAWQGDALYFFDFWDVANGGYVLTGYDTYYTIWEDSSYAAYDYDAAYDEVWEYDDYFASDDFVDEVAFDDAMDEADALDDEADALDDAADEADAAANDAEDEADAAADEADAAADEADDAQDAADDPEADADEAEAGADEDDGGGDDE